MGDIYAFNDPINAIDFLAQQFTGLKVLLRRNDLKDILIISYKSSSERIAKLDADTTIDDEERFKHKYRESLLFYQSVFEKLNKVEKDNIIQISDKVAQRLNTNSITIDQVEKFNQATSDASPGDVIRNGTVLTPKKSKVAVFEREEMTSTDIANHDAYMHSRYPNATKLRSASYKYNCHSYAWFSTSSTNKWWMNNPNKYMTDGSYSESDTAASGYKIYYPMPGNQHSGILTSVNGSIKVTSKWGAYGLYRHTASYCPYFSMYTNTYWIRE
jgi:hypothetical protein